MMNIRKIALLLPVILSVLAFTALAASEPSDNIIFDRADTVKETSIGMDQGLLDSIANVGARVAVQYANTLHHIGLPTLPSSLQTLLDQVSDRIIVQHANTIRQDDLA